MKKVYLVVSIFALIAFLTGIPYLIEGISERGIGGVNYGRVIFPLLISAVTFWLFKKQNHAENKQVQYSFGV